MEFVDIVIINGPAQNIVPDLPDSMKSLDSKTITLNNIKHIVGFEGIGTTIIDYLITNLIWGNEDIRKYPIEQQINTNKSVYVNIDDNINVEGTNNNDNNSNNNNNNNNAAWNFADVEAALSSIDILGETNLINYLSEQYDRSKSNIIIRPDVFRNEIASRHYTQLQRNNLELLIRSIEEKMNGTTNLTRAAATPIYRILGITPITTTTTVEDDLLL